MCCFCGTWLNMYFSEFIFGNNYGLTEYCHAFWGKIKKENNRGLPTWYPGICGNPTMYIQALSKYLDLMWLVSFAELHFKYFDHSLENENVTVPSQ